MAVIIVLNLIVSIVAIAGLAVLMRSAYLVADGRLAHSHPEEQPELPQELELAA